MKTISIFIRLLIKLALIFIILLFEQACMNKQSNTIRTINFEVDSSNVLYVGIDNPINISPDLNTSEINVFVDNGTITNICENCILVRPKNVGIATLTIKQNGATIFENRVLVELVPDPFVGIESRSHEYPYLYKSGGNISKEDILTANGIIVLDFFSIFKLDYKILNFSIRTTIPSSNIVLEETSSSKRFTTKQIQLIKKIVVNQQFNVENITVIGSDDVKRELKPLVFTIVEK